MTSLNLANNNLLAKAIVDGWKASKSLKSICGAISAELDLSGQQLGECGDIPVVCAELKNNRALVKFDVSQNNLAKEGTKALAEALNGNQIMAELNLAENSMGKNGAMDIAKTIPTMGAMTSLDISNNELYAEGAKHVAEAIKGHVSCDLFGTTLSLI